MTPEDSPEQRGWLPPMGSAEAYRLGSKAMYLFAFASVLTVEVVAVTAARHHNLNLDAMMAAPIAPMLAALVGIDLEARARLEETSSQESAEAPSAT